MAETHKEVVKVWIAPGCIVCDACETDCPEVFDVQEETCIIRPDARNAEFTKPLTPSIIVAAEGCPVDVIKFDTIEVEGPEPWAGKEAATTAAAGAGAAGSGGAKKGGGTVIPEGPPSPKWAGLLRTSTARGGLAGIKIEQEAGGNGKDDSGHATAVEDRLPAKAPAQAIAAALVEDAPPDAYDAAMVGSGYSHPRLSVADRIRRKAEGLSESLEMTRRQFNLTLMIAWGALAFTAATLAAAFQSFMVPEVTREPPSIFRAGKIGDYATVGVYEQFKASNGVWLVHLPDGTLVAISDICTHLGCIPNWLPADQKFKCPCHGSGYYMNGINFEGPAPRPLERFKISLDGEFVMVDKGTKFRYELQQWEMQGSSLPV